ncbi:MAG: AraC family transcriptional regulator [Pseudomonadales bacterium]
MNLDDSNHPTCNGGLRDADVIVAIEALLASDPSIVAVARRLSVSVRTLQRRLVRSEATYRRLLDRCRRQRAELELRRGVLSIGEISAQLGYSNPSHFVRAFQRWTGQAPTRFRAALGRTDDALLVNDRVAAESPRGSPTPPR